MKITYDTTKDLLYIRLDSKEQTVSNIVVNDSIILEMNQENKLVGIEILDASQTIDLNQLVPVITQPLNLEEILNKIRT
jgi:uncharacterized protein YuzE